MKFRSLPETDFANITVKRPAEQWVLLNKMERSYAPFSYNPIRRNLPAILQATLPLFPQFSPDSYAEIRQYVAQACNRGEDEKKANLAVADALARFAAEKDVISREVDVSSVRIGAYDKIRYALPLALRLDDRPYLFFPDFRRSGRLSNEACDFIFSVNHHYLLEQDTFFKGYGLAILQFTNPKEGPRAVIPRIFSGCPRYTTDQIEGMVRQTNQIWSNIQIARKKAA